MPSQRRLPLWALVAVFAVVVVLITWGCRRVRQRGYENWTVADLTAHVRAHEPTWQVLPTSLSSAGQLDGVYICARPCSRDEVQRLLRGPSRAASWRGVVLAEVLRDTGGPEMSQWGENGLVIGRVLLFGDPAMLQRIEDTLR